jgi:hypothetical protein
MLGPLSKSLGNIRGNAPRGAPNLAGKGVTLVQREALRQFEDLHSQVISKIVDLEVSMTVESTRSHSDLGFL